jgi:penicillin-binding protein 2
MGRRIGIERIAKAARMAGLGKKYDLPFPSQNYGTVPDSAWKLKKYKQEWSQSDTLNAAIGQGYVLVTPLQLAVAAARIASGRMVEPQLIAALAKPGAPALDVPQEFLNAVRMGMREVVNAGTAIRSRLPLDGIEMAGKTGTAQVRRIEGGMRGGTNVPWRYRDHGLFIFFAPVDKPKYAGAIVIEHGMHGSSAAAPVARDMMTFMFDPAKAMATLETMEAGWGGDIRTRMAREATAYRAEHAAQTAPATATADAAAAAPADSPGNAATNAATAPAGPVAPADKAAAAREPVPLKPGDPE